MNLKDFFKPNRTKIILFLIFFILVYLVLTFTNPKIFPCYARMVIPNNPEFTYTTCNFCVLNTPLSICSVAGSEARPAFISRIMVLTFLLIIPYLLSCIVFSLIKKKGFS